MPLIQGLPGPCRPLWLTSLMSWKPTTCFRQTLYCLSVTRSRVCIGRNDERVLATLSYRIGPRDLLPGNLATLRTRH